MKYTAINIPSLERIANALEKLVEQNNEALEITKKKQVRAFQKEEKELKTLMRDPRYWKHQDLEIIKKVEEGFKRLYG